METAQVNQQVMNFLNGVQEYGAPAFEKISGDDAPVIDVNNTPGVQLVDSQYGKSLEFSTTSGKKYVPVKGEGISQSGKYQLTEWRATRDWAEYNITAGQINKFAIPVS